MKNVLIHVGMHKTATTSMQKLYFPVIQKNGINIRVNDVQIYRYLETCWKFDSYERNTEFNNMKNYIGTINEENLVISMEAFCGDLFTGYKNEDYKQKLMHLKDLFSEQELEVLFARRELLSWVISCYKESVKEHHFMSFDKFVEKFEVGSDGIPTIKAFEIPTICRRLGIKVSEFKFEDIKKDDKIIARHIISRTGNDQMLISEVMGGNKNVGYSLNTIAFILKLKKKFSWIMPRSIYFKGPNSIYRIEKRWNSNLVLRCIKKLFFPIWRGRWFRYLMIRLDRFVWFKKQFSKQAKEMQRLIDERSLNW